MGRIISDSDESPAKKSSRNRTNNIKLDYDDEHIPRRSPIRNKISPIDAGEIRSLFDETPFDSPQVQSLKQDKTQNSIFMDENVNDNFKNSFNEKTFTEDEIESQIFEKSQDTNTSNPPKMKKSRKPSTQLSLDKSEFDKLLEESVKHLNYFIMADPIEDDVLKLSCLYFLTDKGQREARQGFTIDDITFSTHLQSLDDDSSPGILRVIDPTRNQIILPRLVRLGNEQTKQIKSYYGWIDEHRRFDITREENYNKIREFGIASTRGLCKLWFTLSLAEQLSLIERSKSFVYRLKRLSNTHSQNNASPLFNEDIDKSKPIIWEDSFSSQQSSWSKLKCKHRAVSSSQFRGFVKDVKTRYLNVDEVSSQEMENVKFLRDQYLKLKAAAAYYGEGPRFSDPTINRLDHKHLVYIEPPTSDQRQAIQWFKLQKPTPLEKFSSTAMKTISEKFGLITILRDSNDKPYQIQVNQKPWLNSQYTHLWRNLFGVCKLKLYKWDIPDLPIPTQSQQTSTSSNFKSQGYTNLSNISSALHTQNSATQDIFQSYTQQTNLSQFTQIDNSHSSQIDNPYTSECTDNYPTQSTNSHTITEKTNNTYNDKPIESTHSDIHSDSKNKSAAHTKTRFNSILSDIDSKTTHTDIHTASVNTYCPPNTFTDNNIIQTNTSHTNYTSIVTNNTSSSTNTTQKQQDEVMSSNIEIIEEEFTHDIPNIDDEDTSILHTEHIPSHNNLAPTKTHIHSNEKIQVLPKNSDTQPENSNTHKRSSKPLISNPPIYKTTTKVQPKQFKLTDLFKKVMNDNKTKSKAKPVVTHTTEIDESFPMKHTFKKSRLLNDDSDDDHANNTHTHSDIHSDDDVEKLDENTLTIRQEKKKRARDVKRKMRSYLSSIGLLDEEAEESEDEELAELKRRVKSDDEYEDSMDDSELSDVDDLIEKDFDFEDTPEIREEALWKLHQDLEKREEEIYQRRFKQKRDRNFEGMTRKEIEEIERFERSQVEEYSRYKRGDTNLDISYFLSSSESESEEDKQGVYTVEDQHININESQQGVGYLHTSNDVYNTRVRHTDHNIRECVKQAEIQQERQKRRIEIMKQNDIKAHTFTENLDSFSNKKSIPRKGKRKRTFNGTKSLLPLLASTHTTNHLDIFESSTHNTNHLDIFESSTHTTNHLDIFESSTHTTNNSDIFESTTHTFEMLDNPLTHTSDPFNLQFSFPMQRHTRQPLPLKLSYLDDHQASYSGTIGSTKPHQFTKVLRPNENDSFSSSSLNTK